MEMALSLNTALTSKDDELAQKERMKNVLPPHPSALHPGCSCFPITNFCLALSSLDFVPHHLSSLTVVTIIHRQSAHGQPVQQQTHIGALSYGNVHAVRIWSSCNCVDYNSPD